MQSLPTYAKLLIVCAICISIALFFGLLISVVGGV